MTPREEYLRMWCPKKGITITQESDGGWSWDCRGKWKSGGTLPTELEAMEEAHYCCWGG